MLKIIECPRDAIQGLEEFIPTVDKVRYINQLLTVGFDTIDFGSFVSPKAIPQMRDTAAVLSQLNWETSRSKLLAIVANTRGAEDAAKYASIHYLGFPFSISETFQQRNTHKSIGEALNTVDEIQQVCYRTNKKLVTYISMGFGNPYGDPYSTELVAKFVDILSTLKVEVISLADTIGVSTAENIRYLFSNLTKLYPALEIGVHLHSNPVSVMEKISAAYFSGCRRFDGALKGYGGCPMAKDELVGNLPTERIIDFLTINNEEVGIDKIALAESIRLAAEIFPKH